MGPIHRTLDETHLLDGSLILVQDVVGLGILQKVREHHEDSITTIMRGDKTYGHKFTSNLSGFADGEISQSPTKEHNCAVHHIVKLERKISYINDSHVENNRSDIHEWKV